MERGKVNRGRKGGERGDERGKQGDGRGRLKKATRQKEVRAEVE